MKRKPWIAVIFVLGVCGFAYWFFINVSFMAKTTPGEKVSGKKIFAERCATCHGPEGEGLVGPNLTDDYWIQGNGSESSILNLVKEGAPERGMPPWQSVLSDEELRAVTQWVASLRGTSPSHPKPPQGEKVEASPRHPPGSN